MIDPLWNNRSILWKNSRILQTDEVPTTPPNHNDDSLKHDFFHIAIAPVLKFSQLFGVFPLHSVMERLPEKLVFKSYTLTSFVSVVAIFGGYSISALSLKRHYQMGINAINIAEALFFAVCATSAVLFWSLAKEWKSITTAWSQTERVFLSKPFRGSNLRRTIRRTAVVVLILALVEHAFSVAKNIASLQREASGCNWTITKPIKYFSLKTFTTAFDSIPYNLPVAIYNEYVVLAMTFAWNFVDLFIVLVSIGLTTRFNQLSTHISESIRSWKPTSENFWEQMRILYVSLCELVRVLNLSINRLVFVSYANDLYFICLQIMNATKQQPYLISRVYFFYSFSFLLLRTFLMFWFSSRVQDASHVPCKLILRLPNDEYCEEAKRVQMYSKRGVSLTGMGVFVVSRGIFLTVVGTIITYELVLLSYHKKESEQTGNSNVTLCEPLRLD